jgi:hypothetical protein
MIEMAKNASLNWENHAERRARRARMDKIMLRSIRQRIKELRSILIAAPFEGDASHEMVGLRQLLKLVRPRKAADRAHG